MPIIIMSKSQKSPTPDRDVRSETGTEWCRTEIQKENKSKSREPQLSSPRSHEGSNYIPTLIPKPQIHGDPEHGVRNSDFPIPGRPYQSQTLTPEPFILFYTLSPTKPGNPEKTEATGARRGLKGALFRSQVTEATVLGSL